MPLLSGPFMLPAPLQRRLEHAAGTFFDPGQHAIDFAAPRGEPALSSPDSVSWRVFRNPLALFVGGIAAVLLELAEPRIRAGVWEHTAFRGDPLRRIRRTGYAAMVTVYGPRSQAEAMIAAVGRRHAQVRGATADGRAYRADDPELLSWVHATASFGFLAAYETWVGPLGQAAGDRFFAEARTSARLYGAVHAPASRAAMETMMSAVAPSLEATPVHEEFLAIMRAYPLLPAPLDRLQGMLVAAAVELVPPALRSRLALERHAGLRPWQRLAMRRLGSLADRLLLRTAPAVRACRRLGLPDDYLYRDTEGKAGAAIRRGKARTGEAGSDAAAGAAGEQDWNASGAHRK